MAEITARECAQRSDQAWDIRDLWRSLLSEAYELALAARNPYTGSKKNAKPMNRQFDSTAPISVIRAANRLLMELTPPDYEWVNLAPGPLLEMQFKENDIAVLKKQLQPVVKMLALVFSSGKFINAIWEMYIDLLIAGMGCLLVMPNKKNDVEPVSVTCVSQSEVATEYDAHGDLCGVYRKRSNFKVRQILQMWPDAKMPAELEAMLKKQASGKAQDPEIDLLETCCYGEAWEYKVQWRKSGDDPVVIYKTTYATCPWVIFNWSRLPGLPYGPGPVLLALPDIRTANMVVEMLLKNSSLALAGMYIAQDDGVLNPATIRITPGGIIPVARTGGPMGSSIAPLPTSRNFDVSQLVLEELRGNIKKTLFDNALPAAESTVRSPTEIMERVRELSQDIGGNIGRFTTDLVQLVRRVMDIQHSLGLIPPVKVDQYALKVQVNSPLARAQALNEVKVVVEWLSTVNQLGGPQAVMLAAKVEDIYGWIAGKMGVAPDLLRDRAEREQMQQQVAQIVASQQAGALPAQPAAALAA